MRPATVISRPLPQPFRGYCDAERRDASGRLGRSTRGAYSVLLCRSCEHRELQALPWTARRMSGPLILRPGLVGLRPLFGQQALSVFTGAQVLVSKIGVQQLLAQMVGRKKELLGGLGSADSKIGGP